MGRAAPGATVSRGSHPLGVSLRCLPGGVPGSLREADAGVGHARRRDVPRRSHVRDAGLDGRGRTRTRAAELDRPPRQRELRPGALASRRLAAGCPLLRDDGVLAFLWDPGYGHGDVSLALGRTHSGGNRRNGCGADGMGAGIRHSGWPGARGRAGSRDSARRRSDDDRGLVVPCLRRHVRSGPR